MSNLKIFHKSLYDDLLLNMSDNRRKYLKPTSFIYEEYDLASNEYSPVVKLILPKNDDNYEVENSIALYDSLKKLDMSIIIDKRFWTTLSHTYYYDYIQSRIPVPTKKSGETIDQYNKKLDSYINDHYFQDGWQRRSRHTLSGLWWRAHLTYDERLDDPFEYTKKLNSFTDRDLMNAMIENTLYVKYPELTKAFIDEVLKIDYKQIQGNKREFNRDLAALINLEGSTRLFNMLSYQDFSKIIKEIIGILKEP